MNLPFALLVDSSLKAALLCLAALGVAVLCRRGSAALRHDLCLAALAGCILLPFVAAAMRLIDAAPGAAPVHEAVMAVTPSLPDGVPPRAIELVDRIWSGDGGGATFGNAALLLVLLWLAGVLLEALRGLSAWHAAAAIVRRARHFASPDPSLDVRITGELGAPAVFGVRAPTILLPAEAAEWPNERLRAVLAHEAAHVRRRDGAVELVAELACALHWCNPLVRAVAKTLRREREIACDEHVLHQGFDAGRYAGALVAVARRCRVRQSSLLLAMASMPELERRVRRLLASPRAARGGGGLRAFVIGPPLMLFLAGAAFTAPAAGVLGAGSVQPGVGPLAGLDDPLSERLPFDYDGAAAAAAALPPRGRDAGVIAILQAELGRTPRGPLDLVRERAIWVLAHAEGGRLFEPLAARTGDGDWRVRAYSAWGLTVFGDGRSTPLLVALLDDPVWRVRAMAAAGLAGTADPAASEAVGALAADPAWQVRMAALDYLDRVRNPVLARRLRPLLDDPHNGTRIFAAGVFAGL